MMGRRAVEPTAPEEGGGKERDEPAVGILFPGFPLGAQKADQVEPEDGEEGEGEPSGPFSPTDLVLSGRSLF